MLLDMFSIYIALSSLRLLLKFRQPVAGHVARRVSKRSDQYLNSSTTGSAGRKLSHWENADFNREELWSTKPRRYIGMQRDGIRVSATALNAVLGPAQYSKEQLLQPNILSSTNQAVSTTKPQAINNSPPPVLSKFARRCVGRINAQIQKSSLLLPTQVSQLGAASTTSGKALDLGRGEPWEKAAHKLGLLPFPAASSLKSTEASAKAYSPEGGKTKKTPVVRKTSGGKKAGADRSMDESSKPKQRKPRAKRIIMSVTLQSDELIMASSKECALVIDSVEKATRVVQQLMGKYKDVVHVWDTEHGEIDVKKESPVGHGRIPYFSIYCGPSGNFGDGKNRLSVDVLDDGQADVMKVLKPYFEDPCVKKIWHNYSFNKHMLSRHGIHAQRFFQADSRHTMYLAMARLNDFAGRGAKGV